MPSAEREGYLQLTLYVSPNRPEVAQRQAEAKADIDRRRCCGKRTSIRSLSQCACGLPLNDLRFGLADEPVSWNYDDQ